MDADELKPALEKLGLFCSDRNIEKIARAWDADGSGRLDLLEFTDLVRTLQTFMKYDLDKSGDIDVEELRPALRRLGLPGDTDMANAVLSWYDHDDSGRIELHEFAVLARDVSVFTAFDKDHSGTLDAAELLPALGKLGLAASEKEVRRIIDVWDDNNQGTINLLEFAEIIRDLQVFEQFDVDRSGFISTAELRSALGKLGVHMSHPQCQALLVKYDTDQSGLIEFPEFRQLAEDLPNLVGRSKGSFFKLHHGDSAYVHAGDVLDEEMHFDLDQTFKRSSVKRSTKKQGTSGAAGSVLGSVASGSGAVLATAAAGPVYGAPPPSGSILGSESLGERGGVNPFDSRLGFGGGRSNAFDSRLSARASEHGADSLRGVRVARLQGSEKPTLHVSRNMVRD